MRKTRHFYKRIQKYINYVSTPPTSAEENWKKQAVLEKLWKMIDRSPKRLAEYSDGSETIPDGKRSGHNTETHTESSHVSLKHQAIEEPSTREAATSRSVGEVQIIVAEESEHAVEAIDRSQEQMDVHQKKIAHLRQLRKELKHLERLERMQMINTLQKADAALNPRLDSSETDISSMRSETVTFYDLKRPAQNQVETEHRSEKGSDKSCITVKESTTKARSFDSPSLSQKTRNTNKGLQSPKPGSLASKRTPQESGMKNAYHQPPITTSAESQKRNVKSKGVQTAEKLRQPVAYYLNVGNASPIVTGIKLIRKDIKLESSGIPPEQKENRNLLANYAVSLEASAMKIKTVRENSGKASDKDDGGIDTDKEPRVQKILTLSDALYLSRPRFIARAENRRIVLQQMRTHRQHEEDRHRKWLEEMANMSPGTRQRVRPAFQPQQPVRRLFSQREMIEQNRRLYRQLPEVRGKARESKRCTYRKTNQILQHMYKKRLQQKVLTGNVSIPHHDHVIKF